MSCMKSCVCAFVLVCRSAMAAITINEFHYDNVGTDIGEFVEVAADTCHRQDIIDSKAILYLYNGADGKVYGSHNLEGFQYHGTLADGKDYYSKLISGIQNGSPDGFALVFDGVVVEFISYEGIFTATEGPAQGMTSVEIGVYEPSDAPVGSSLQRIAFSDHWVYTPGTNTR
ncbi:MAG: hypothetical protein QHH07_00990, partial [Sedimentisphaerales bacterium]|nr:hypothetical protein [Sedimentisphaerales bacterium]